MIGIAIIQLTTGLVSAFYGYRLLRPSTFLVGYFFGGLIAYEVIEYPLRQALFWLVINICGLVLGSILYWLQPLGMFAIGSMCGIMAGYLISYSLGFDYYMLPIPLFIMWGVGILFGILAVVFKHRFLTFSFSWIGSQCIFSSIGNFAGKYPEPYRVEEGRPLITPPAWWYYLTGIVLLCGLGIQVQFQDFELVGDYEDSQVYDILHWNSDEYESELGIGPKIIASLAIALGWFVTTAPVQTKYYRLCNVVAGCTIGSVVFFIAASSLFSKSDSINTLCWSTFIFGGLLVGAFSWWLDWLGYFCAGVLSGVLIAAIIQISFGYLIYPSNPHSVLILLASVLGLFIGLTGVKLQRPSLKFTSASYGAIMTVWGIGFFVGGYPNAVYLDRFSSDYNNDPFPTRWWYYLGGTVLFFFMGLYCQHYLAKKIKESDENSVDDNYSFAAMRYQAGPVHYA
ncbi:hypothetical protein THRCLA_11047 [Thraustotheca clavata]|uniref:Transmembrane protein 198 n=1 Tax=Thraustotheca clavata TaxID=74557 RepID=A0A1V9Y8Z4_9STRA|nr:hypothetical protein THRCLA_11047 [Thraustotheca clavata]